MLKIKNASKIYKLGDVEVPALNNVTLTIKEGEMLCIMGRSGSGKSTLLRILGLIDSPTKGKIYLSGKDVGKLKEKVRSRIRLETMGYVFQEYALLSELTALENVYLPAKMLGRWPKEYKDRAITLLDAVGLLNRMKHLPRQLSGGQQQRVAIARAMVNKPEIIFADEPTANLDSKAGKNVMETLYWLNKNYKTTIVFVSHDESDKKYASRVVRLLDGRIVKRKPI
ncbi:ABC transporter ATP-binding protein [Candidatus Saccharibacteria bacterium]|jgi:putative ABC transport system ATP-binding protein|nr:ABC transporter ATP-binding protein [Candidatus Saccharibacteria bacterium]